MIHSFFWTFLYKKNCRSYNELKLWCHSQGMMSNVVLELDISKNQQKISKTPSWICCCCHWIQALQHKPDSGLAGGAHCYHCCSTQSWSRQRLDWYQFQKKYFKTMFPEISTLRFEDFYIPANSAFIRLTVLVDLETAGIEPDASWLEVLTAEQPQAFHKECLSKKL